jgi:hypothetical protein
MQMADSKCSDYTEKKPENGGTSQRKTENLEIETRLA